MKARILAPVVMLLTLAAPAAAHARDLAPAGDRLDTARTMIFDGEWDKAIAELRRVIVDRKEPLRDEAQFWLAHSLFQTGRAAEALSVIGTLETDYVRSRWLLPAQSLRVEIATKMGRPDVLWRVATPSARTPTPAAPRMTPAPTRTPRPGRTPAPPAPPTIVALTTEDIQIQALSVLIHQEPDKAIPQLRSFALSSEATPQARRALLALSLSPDEDARATIVEVAQKGPEPLRVAAVNHIARWRTPEARNVLTTTYTSGSDRVKIEVLRSLGAAGEASYIYQMVIDERDPSVRASGIYGIAVARGGRELEMLYNRRPAPPREERLKIIDALFAAKGARELTRIARQESDDTLKNAALERLRLLGAR